MTTENEKYEAPKLREHGSIEQITHGTSDGAVTDAAFPTGTPFGDVTFS